MTRVLLIRHGRTAWNDDRRIQGHIDIPLSDTGRKASGALRVPPEYLGWRAYTSPLARAVETATLLGLESPLADPRLMEMRYGDWEGATWDELKARHGESLAARQRRGLDFRPDGGESPRDLRARLLSWLDEVRAAGADTVAVTHKGVIRMALAMATGWDLVSRAPARLKWDRGHLFELPRSGPHAIRVNALNLSLQPP